MGVYKKKSRSTEHYNTEKNAYKIFYNKNWCPELISYNDNERILEIKYYDIKKIEKLKENESQLILKNILTSIYDLYKTGYIHMDLHINNILILKDNSIKLIDFEYLQKHNNECFFSSYDVIGDGYKSPLKTGNMCIMKNHDLSISNIFNIKNIEELRELYKNYKIIK